MKKLLALAALTTVTVMSANPVYAVQTISDKSSQRAQVGYSFGYLMGKSNSNALNDLDYEQFLQGFKAGYAGDKSALSNDQMIKVLSQFKKQADAKALVDLQKTAADNLKAGDDFLKKNLAQNPTTVKVTASGLQYQVLREGAGVRPTLKNQVTVNYEGRLLDGTVFDSSIARDKPVTFPLNQVIAGWQEGLPLMREGSKYRFFIPAKLAYGEIGSGDTIGPNSTLIFDVELLKVL